MAKDLVKSENENREHVNLLTSVNQNVSFKQSYVQSDTLCSIKHKQTLIDLNNSPINAKNLSNGFTNRIPLFSSPKNEYKNLNNLIKSDEIYGFTPLNQIMKSESNLNQLSTFQVNTKNNIISSGKMPKKNTNLSVQQNNEEQKLIRQQTSSYTNRLPPVPRRNSKTGINNSTNNLSLNNSLKNVNKLNASVVSNRTGSSSNLSSSDTSSSVIKSYYQKL